MMSKLKSWRPARWESCGKVRKMLKVIVIDTGYKKADQNEKAALRNLLEISHKFSNLTSLVCTKCHRQTMTLLLTSSISLLKECFRNMFFCLFLSLISKQVGCWLFSKRSYKRGEKWGKAFVCAHSAFRSSSHHARCLKPSTELWVAPVRPIGSNCG